MKDERSPYHNHTVGPGVCPACNCDKQTIRDLEGQVEKLLAHLPDACKSGECSTEGAITVADATAMTMNMFSHDLSVLPDDRLIALADYMGDMVDRAVHTAIKDRETKLAEAKSTIKLRNALIEQQREMQHETNESLDKANGKVMEMEFYREHHSVVNFCAHGGLKRNDVGLNVIQYCNDPCHNYMPADWTAQAGKEREKNG